MSFDRKKRDSETQGRVNEFGTVFQKDLDSSLSNPADVLCDCSGPTQFAVCPLFQVGDNGIVSTPIFCTPDWMDVAPKKRQHHSLLHVSLFSHNWSSREVLNFD